MAKDSKSMATPRLRFPAFRDADAWEPKPLGSLCEVLNNRRLPISSDRRTAGPYPYYGASGIVDFISEYIFDERLLLVGEDGAKWGSFERTAFIVEGKYWVNNHAHVLKPIEANDAFLENYLTMANLSPFVTGAAPPKLTLAKLKTIPVPIPQTWGEQRKIADCLMSLDEVIAAQGRKVEALKAHKQGLMQQLFPRAAETLPRLRFPEFRKGSKWAMKKIGDMLEETVRPIEMDDDEEYALVTVKRRYGGVVSRERLTGRAIKVKSQFIVKSNDFLISKRQIVHNACGLVPPGLDGSIVSNEYSVLGPKDGCDIEFFNYFSQQPAVSASFLRSSVGIVIEKMLFKLDSWLRLEFLFPSIEEQRQIAGCLKSVEDEVAAASEKLHALKTHKKGLMQQLFPSPVGD